MSAVLALLDGAGLPTSDLSPETQVRWWVLESGGAIAGVIGLQGFGREALLRSLAVAPTHHKRGVARQLVGRLEREALAAGIERLVLLTQTAESFFRHLGYENFDRARASDAMRRCAEFSSLCPASATCMGKALVRESAS